MHEEKASIFSKQKIRGEKMCNTAEQMPRKILDSTKCARVIQVIETKADRGLGTKQDPVRGVTQYWDLDGKTWQRLIRLIT